MKHIARGKRMIDPKLLVAALALVTALGLIASRIYRRLED